MKTILKFDSQCDGDDYKLLLIKHVEDMSRAIYESKQYIRSKLKYEEVSDETEKHLEAIRELLYIYQDVE